MSKGSKLGVKSKSDLQKKLEQVHQNEIDEYLLTRSIPVCCGCGVDLMNSKFDTCSECFYAYADDQYWYEEEDLEDDWHEPDGYLLSDYEDDYFDYYDEDLTPLIPGRHYRHEDGQTYLCCRIDKRTLLVSLLTGEEVFASSDQLTMISH